MNETEEAGWAVTIDVVLAAPLDDNQVGDIVDILGATVSVSPDRRRLSTTLDVLESHVQFLPNAISEAANRFMEAIAKVDGIVRDVVSAEGMRFAEQDARLAEPAFPTLAGVAELAERLGVSKQRIVTLSKNRGFPAAVANLHSGPVWRLEDVSRFESTWTRRSGRPRVDVEPVKPSRRHVIELNTASG